MFNDMRHISTSPGVRLPVTVTLTLKLFFLLHKRLKIHLSKKQLNSDMKVDSFVPLLLDALINRRAGHSRHRQSRNRSGNIRQNDAIKIMIVTAID